MGKAEDLLHLFILWHRNSKRVITVFETCGSKISILFTKYYESPFEN